MGLLKDQDLVASIKVKDPTVPYVSGLDLPENPYSANSPVQGASVNLSVGHIYLPGKKKHELGGIENPRSTHSLKTGQTAVVTTKESLQLPNDIAGFGFPPSRVSFAGLLMTNPGHVDPGYSGVMRFTVINMAKEPYELNRGDRIVRLLLFKLEGPVQAGWGQRNPQGSPPPNEEQVSRLAEDFVDVDKRAKEIAKKQGLKWSMIIAAAATLLSVILQLWGSGWLSSRRDIEDLKRRQDLVEYDLKNRVEIERKLQDMDNRMKDLGRAKTSSVHGKNQ